MKSIIILLVGAIIVSASSSKYDGYNVLKIDLGRRENAELLRNFDNFRSLDFLTPLNKVGNPVKVLVPPEILSNFLNYLRTHQIKFVIEVRDIEAILHKEAAARLANTKLKQERITFDRYYSYDEIGSYLAELAQNFPDIVTLESIGKSYEGRDLTVIHVSTGGDKPTFWVDAGIHAREWIAPALALYIINQLVENEGNRNLLENVNWSILPSVNPDGYEYSWAEERFWRKTRSPGDSNCYGTDANRNFDFHWNEVGADNDPCSEIYAGPKVASENETIAVQNYLSNAQNIALYLTLHSCGQYILYPWGWTASLPDNWEELDDLGQRVNDAIRAVAGTEYTVGSITNALYAASGNSEDWAKGVPNIPISYTIELPCGGFLGFDLPEEDIQPVVTETWEGIKVLHGHIANRN